MLKEKIMLEKKAKENVNYIEKHKLHFMKKYILENEQ